MSTACTQPGLFVVEMSCGQPLASIFFMASPPLQRTRARRAKELVRYTDEPEEAAVDNDVVMDEGWETAEAGAQDAPANDDQLDAIASTIRFYSDDDSDEGYANMASPAPPVDFGFSSDEDYEIDDEAVMHQEGIKNTIREALLFRNKSRPRSSTAPRPRRNANRELDTEVRVLVSQANEAFVRHDLGPAEQLYREVVEKDRKNFGAYKTLGEIARQRGDLVACCSMWYMAAHINLWDHEFWGTVAQLSAELDNPLQAIYCYKRAIAALNGSDTKSIFNRALLYREVGHVGRALELFQKLHKAFPSDRRVLKQLALCYVDQNRVVDAILLYLRVFDANVNHVPAEGETEDDLPFPKFDWSELNILAEMYTKIQQWEPCTKVVRLALRWLSGRALETFWLDLANDLEFDERRFANPKFKKLLVEEQNRNHDLPVDIRVKLGFCRLHLKDSDEAMRHFECLFRSDIMEVPDLFNDAGKGLERAGLYLEALRFLEPLAEFEEFHTVDLVTLVLSCQQETGQYHKALEGYLWVLSEDPDNLDVKLALAETYFHTGDMAKLRQYTREVAEARQDLPVPEEELPRSRKYNKQLEEQREEEEKDLHAKVRKKFSTLERLWPDVHDPVARTAWEQLALQLIDMFGRVKAFFPKDKLRRFIGLMAHKRKRQMNIDERLTLVYQLYDSSGDVEVDRTKTEFRGVAYRQWFVLFMRYALTLAKYLPQMRDEALGVVELAQTCAVFHHEPAWDHLMPVVRMLVGLLLGDYGVVMLTVRGLLNHNQFNPTVLRLFLASFPLGQMALVVFTSGNHLKYFLRQIKALDLRRLGEEIEGMATITNTEAIVAEDNPYLVFIYGVILLGLRLYVLALGYLQRLYRHWHKDPMLVFVIGLCHLHRAMQRLLVNRHFQVLQGLLYLVEYGKLRGEGLDPYKRQEVAYNHGRAYHMLGLTTLAMRYYEQVLEFEGLEPEYDLRVEAAHNLALVYETNGNFRAAAAVVDKYLVV